MNAHDGTSFDFAWARAARVSGWLTRDQARLLWDQATRLGGRSEVLEIGSHQGRSTVILGLAVQPTRGRVIAVDPFVEGRLFGGTSTRQLFEGNIASAALGDVVELVPDYSTKLRPHWSRGFDMLYIDGKHDYWTVSDDLRWSDYLPPGGAVLIHDCFSSIGVTLGILVRVLPTTKLVYVGRAGSLALFRTGRPTTRDRLRIVAELPWWVRNVVIKVLLRLRLRSVARLVFKHDSPYDPY